MIKILTFDKPEGQAKEVSFKMYVDSDEKGQPSNFITAAHYNEINPAFVRHIQVSGGYITVSRYGYPSVGFHADDLIKMLVSAMPETTFPPKIVTDAQPTKLDKAATLTVKAVSEIPFIYQWQQFDGAEWKDCSGQNGESLTTEAAGKYRCVCISEAGQSVSKEIEVK